MNRKLVLLMGLIFLFGGTVHAHKKNKNIVPQPSQQEIVFQRKVESMSQDKCKVCWYNCDNNLDNTIVLSCEHKFHQKCFDAWIRFHERDSDVVCPCCKSVIDRDIKEKIWSIEHHGEIHPQVWLQWQVGLSMVNFLKKIDTFPVKLQKDKVVQSINAKIVSILPLLSDDNNPFDMTKLPELIYNTIQDHILVDGMLLDAQYQELTEDQLLTNKKVLAPTTQSKKGGVLYGLGAVLGFSAGTVLSESVGLTTRLGLSACAVAMSYCIGSMQSVTDAGLPNKNKTALTTACSSLLGFMLGTCIKRNNV